MYGGLEFFYNNKLNKLRGCLCADTLDLKDILKQIDELSKYKNIEKYSYFNSLLYPEKARGCKIPSQVSASSCSFQLRNTMDITIPGSGSFIGCLNPFFLANTEYEGRLYEDVFTYGFYMGSQLTTFWKNDGASDGREVSYPMETWFPYNFYQVIPSVYSEYRLVSASLRIKYTGILKEVSGTIGCGIWTSPLPYVGAKIRPRKSSTEVYDPAREQKRTGAFIDDITIDSIRHCSYFVENQLLKGFRALYFPLDNSYLEYTKICDRNSFSVNYFESDIAQSYEGKRAVLSLDDVKFKNGFNWVFFVDGGPKSKKCLRMELFCNFECFPTPESMQYMPITNEGIFDLHEDMNLAITSVRNKPISVYC